jgi:hypothetical protein
LIHKSTHTSEPGSTLKKRLVKEKRLGYRRMLRHRYRKLNVRTTVTNGARAFGTFLFLFSSTGLLAQDKTLSEAYSGVAMGTGGSVGGKTIQFDFRITQYTKDEEVQDLAQLVKGKGTDAVRSALEKEDKGRIDVVGSTGNRSPSCASANKAPTPQSLSLPPARCLLSSATVADAALTSPLVFFR